MANWSGLPSIVSVLPNDVRNFLQRVKEILDNAMSGATRFITVTDLTNGNIATLDTYGNLVSISTGESDFTPPPAPTNVQASGALTTIIVTWTDPFYANMSYAEIWRNSSDAQGTAVKIGTSQGVIYADSVAPGSTYYYWVRFVSKANVIGAFQSLAGVKGVTSADPTYVLSILTGQITESQLHATLGTSIDAIEPLSTLSLQLNLLADDLYVKTLDLRSTTDTTSASLNQEQLVRATEDSALATQLTTLTATVTTGDATNAAAIQSEATTRASADSANASNTTTLTARLDTGDFAAVKTESSASASAVTGLNAQYTVKVDTGGKVAGFGIASTSPTAGTGTSIFEVRADKIAFAAPASATGITTIVPFVVDTVNNQVAMDAAFIKTATINSAQIADLAVTTAKISSLTADKLTTGSIAVGQDVTSTGFVTGSTGWKISGSGTVEFSNAIVRGAIYASSGTFAGSLSAATGTFAGSLSAATGSFTGSLSAATGTFAGSLSAASGSFTGSLTAATGSFAGSLSAVTGSFKGYVAVGDFTSYAFPAAGGTGAYLGSEGLLLGNINTSTGNPNGYYFKVDTPVGGAPSISTNIPAYLADAQVSTLKIAGNAVTFSVSASNNTTTAITTINTWVDLFTSSITTTGLGVFIAGQTTNTLNMTGSAANIGSFKTRLLQDSIQIWIGTGKTAVIGGSVTDVDTAIASSSVAAGTHTYILQIYLTVNASDASSFNANTSANLLYLQETKR